MTNHRRLKDEVVKAALKLTAGKVHPAAKLLGISKQALHQRLAKKPWLSPKMDRLEEAAQHLSTATLCAEFGEAWAVQNLLSVCGWGKEEKSPRRKTNFTDGQVQDLIKFAGGDIQVFNYHKKLLGKYREYSLAGRRRIIECAAAIALDIIPKEVWPRFCSEWVKLKNDEVALGLKSAKKSASDGKPRSELSTLYRVEL